MVTFSLATLPSEWVPAARLAANGWNRSLAAAGKKTRLVEIADNANIGVIAGDLTKVLGMSYSDTQAVTWQFKGGLTSHPDWLAAPSTIALNIAFKANFAADGMLPVQLFGHEFGHALGLADVNGNQLMAGATQYTTNGEVTPSLPLGEYTPNICEVAKLADNGLP